MLKAVSLPGFYETLGKKTLALMDGFKAAAREAGIPLTTNQVGGMFGYFFSAEPVISRYSQVTQCDIERFKRFYHLMLEEGIYLAPSAYEAGFVSAAHGDSELDRTLSAVRKVMKQL
jgi:glutamate-1-semialdehyde 2,1-aminomutase